jgi:2-amino-4-hydroxy-6-hydroxymethyldihydropteridine diphosphokinase
MERAPVTAYVALGANLGDAEATVLQAIRALDGLEQTSLACRSSLYRSAPLDADGPDYVNAVVGLHTRLSAPDLLRALQRIEHGFGRVRAYRNSPRTLDLDLLLYGAARIVSDALTLPHPRMGQRAFVLVPLAEIAPALVPPGQLRAVSDQVLLRLP